MFPVSTDDLSLVSKAMGPLPLINHILSRLRLDELLEQYVPCADGRLKLAPAVGLGVLLRNVLVAREPLYGLSEWASRFDEALLGLPRDSVRLLNDDRVGRCLDSLFLADRAALMTAVVVRAIRTFEVDLDELHNDSTTVTFTGQYRSATGRAHRRRPTHRITFGHNKDYRPDLKQLLWVLTTSADGGVPVWCSVDHGNTTDDQTHIQTWNTLRRLVGKADFLYIADSKLCTKENMAHITQHSYGSRHSGLRRAQMQRPRNPWTLLSCAG
jgi:transposase